MGKGFFKQDDVTSKKIANNNSKLAQCGKCGLYKSCANPQMQPTGNNTIPFLTLNDGPSEREDYKNEQLIGDSGQFHRRKLRKFGYHIDDGIKDGAIRCHTPEKKTMTQITSCRPKIQETVHQNKPHVILALGESALKSLISHKFDKDIGSIGKWRGSMIPDREYNAWICPMFHPSYCLGKKAPEIAEKIYEEDLQSALNLLDVPLPYYTKEDEESKVEILKHPKDINKWLNSLIHYDDIQLTAFDFETTGLKPYREGHSIRTCSISYGPDHAVAFPMIKSIEFQKLFSRYTASTYIKKIAANAPFERDWTSICLDQSLNEVFFDTQLAAHVLDNRPRITSLEFQNYVNFGIEPYDSEIKEYLKSKDVNGKDGGGNDFNTIYKADLRKLLIYNGMDSMTEFRLALVQMDRLGIDYSHLYNGVRGTVLAPQYLLTSNPGDENGKKKGDEKERRRVRRKKKARKPKKKENADADVSRKAKRKQ